MAIKHKFTFRHAIQRCSQVFTVLVCKVLVRPFTQVDTSLVKPEVIHNRSYLLISNHRSKADPLVLSSALPFRSAWRMMPAAFMTSNFFYDSPIRPILWVNGCYPARNPKGKHLIYGVDGSIQLLQNNFSIFMFPEGKLVKDAPRAEAHSGVWRIHQAAPNVPFVLCHVEYNRTLKGFLTGKVNIVRFKLVENPSYPDATSIMDDIYAL